MGRDSWGGGGAEGRGGGGPLVHAAGRAVALGGGDHEVAAAGVEDHGELLRRSPDGDLENINVYISLFLGGDSTGETPLKSMVLKNYKHVLS